MSKKESMIDNIFKLSNNEYLLPFPKDVQNLIQLFNQENKILKDKFDNCIFMIQLKSIKYKKKIKPEKYNKCKYCKKYDYSNKKICQECNERIWLEIG